MTCPCSRIYDAVNPMCLWFHAHVEIRNKINGAKTRCLSMADTHTRHQQCETSTPLFSLLKPWCISPMCHHSTGEIPTTKSLSSGSRSGNQENGWKRAHTNTSIPRGKRPASFSTAKYNKGICVLFHWFLNDIFLLCFSWNSFCDYFACRQTQIPSLPLAPTSRGWMLLPNGMRR